MNFAVVNEMQVSNLLLSFMHEDILKYPVPASKTVKNDKEAWESAGLQLFEKYWTHCFINQ